MPAIGGFLGWNDPPPAAMTTILQSNTVSASVVTRKRGASGVPSRLQRGHHLVEVEGRAERLDLLHQIVDEPHARDDRKAGNVVDRLLRIELGALPADFRQDVDQMRLDVEQARARTRRTARPGPLR